MSQCISLFVLLQFIAFLHCNSLLMYCYATLFLIYCLFQFKTMPHCSSLSMRYFKFIAMSDWISQLLCYWKSYLCHFTILYCFVVSIHSCTILHVLYCFVLSIHSYAILHVLYCFLLLFATFAFNIAICYCCKIFFLVAYIDMTDFISLVQRYCNS